MELYTFQNTIDIYENDILVSSILPGQYTLEELNTQLQTNQVAPRKVILEKYNGKTSLIAYETLSDTRFRVSHEEFYIELGILSTSYAFQTLEAILPANANTNPISVGQLWVPTSFPYTYNVSIYGNGIFVVFDNPNQMIRTSSDTVNWTSTAYPRTLDYTYGDISCGAYGDGIFVAIFTLLNADSQRIIRSTDGVQWTLQTTATADDTNLRWKDIVYGNNVFVAIAQDVNNRRNDLAMRSEDGISWVIHSLPEIAKYETLIFVSEFNYTLEYYSLPFISIAYGNNLFVAVPNLEAFSTETDRETDIIVTSADGITWNVRNAPSGWDNLNAIAFGNNTFVAVGYQYIYVDFKLTINAVIIYSTDGVNWSKSSISFRHALVDVSFSDGWFVAISASNQFLRSQNGISWSVVSSVTGSWNTIQDGFIDSTTPVFLVTDSSTLLVSGVNDSDAYIVGSATESEMVLASELSETLSSELSDAISVELSTDLSLDLSNEISEDAFILSSQLSSQLSTEIFNELDSILSSDLYLDSIGAIQWNPSLEFFSGVRIETNATTQHNAVVVYPITSTDALQWTKHDPILVTTIDTINGDSKRILSGVNSVCSVIVYVTTTQMDWFTTTDGVTWTHDVLLIPSVYSSFSISTEDIFSAHMLWIPHLQRFCVSVHKGLFFISLSPLTIHSGVSVILSADVISLSPPMLINDIVYIYANLPSKINVYYFRNNNVWALVPSDSTQQFIAITWNPSFQKLFAVLKDTTTSSLSLAVNTSDKLYNPWMVVSDVSADWENIVSVQDNEFTFVCAFSNTQLAIYIDTWNFSPYSETNHVLYPQWISKWKKLYYFAQGTPARHVLTNQIIRQTLSFTDNSIFSEFQVQSNNQLTLNTTIFEILAPVNITDTLDVSGNTTLLGTLNVSGNTSVSGTLDVSGNTRVEGTLDVSVITPLAGTLTADGNTVVGGTLDISGNTSVGGNTTLTGTLNVNGNTTLAGTLNVSGNTTMDDMLYVEKDVTLGSDIILKNLATYSTNSSTQIAEKPFSVRQVADNVNIVDGIYANNVFVLICNKGGINPPILTSLDGITWTKNSLSELENTPSDRSWQCVAYGNGRFIVVPNTGIKSIYSLDGLTWNFNTPMNPDIVVGHNWCSVTHGNGIFVAVSSTSEVTFSGGGYERFMYSTDGEYWDIPDSSLVSVTTRNNTWRSVTFGDSKFVAVASDGHIMYSFDGYNWIVFAAPAYHAWQSVTYGTIAGNGLFVAVASSGTGNRVMTSPNGINWTLRSSVADYNWTNVKYGVFNNIELFFAVADSGAERVMASLDGIQWFLLTNSTFDYPWSTLLIGPKSILAVSLETNGFSYIMESPILELEYFAKFICTNGITYLNNKGNGGFVFRSDESDATTELMHLNNAGVLTVNGQTVSSDDRLKFHERFIQNATSSLLKLRPQLYRKSASIIPSSSLENTTQFPLESGLIAQEIYYDAPELRHLVQLPLDADIPIVESLSIELSSENDPSIDPQWTGWGLTPASVNYVGLIPYLIRGFQELQQELSATKSILDNLRL